MRRYDTRCAICDRDNNALVCLHVDELPTGDDSSLRNLLVGHSDCRARMPVTDRGIDLRQEIDARMGPRRVRPAVRPHAVDHAAGEDEAKGYEKMRRTESHMNRSLQAEAYARPTTRLAYASAFV